MWEEVLGVAVQRQEFRLSGLTVEVKHKREVDKGQRRPVQLSRQVFQNKKTRRAVALHLDCRLLTEGMLDPKTHGGMRPVEKPLWP